MEIDRYTYKQILIGLRNEFLEAQKKLNQLMEHVNIYDGDMHNNYYFNLYKSPYEKSLPELVLERNVKTGFLQKLGIIQHPPTRTLMVKDNNGIYYPLRKNTFKRNDFNLKIIKSNEKEFQEMVEEILNSDFAKYMTLDSIITAINSQSRPRIVARSFQFDLVTDKSQIEYCGRKNTMKFASIKEPKGEWEPLTQEHLDYVLSIEFPKHAFSEWHQSIIEKYIDDDKHIILAEHYKPELNATFEIQDRNKQLILTKTPIKKF